MMLFAYRRLNRAANRNEELERRLSQCLLDLNATAQTVTKISNSLANERQQEKQAKQKVEQEKKLAKTKADEELFSSVMQELLS